MTRNASLGSWNFINKNEHARRVVQASPQVGEVDDFLQNFIRLSLHGEKFAELFFADEASDAVARKQIPVFRFDAVFRKIDLERSGLTDAAGEGIAMLLAHPDEFAPRSSCSCLVFDGVVNRQAFELPLPNGVTTGVAHMHHAEKTRPKKSERKRGSNPTM